VKRKSRTQATSIVSHEITVSVTQNVEEITMQNFRRYLIIVCFFLATFIQINLAQNFWQPTNGPYGGGVSGVGQDSNGTIYCGTMNGVFRSSDHGDHWEFSSPTLPKQIINHFYMIHNDIMLATVNNGDLYRSTDLGNSWSSVLLLSSNYYITDLAFDSAFTTVYLVGYPLNGMAQVYCSHDNGATWIQSATGITSTQVYSVAVNQKNGFVFINSFDGVYRSTNKGSNWQLMNNGITNAGMFGYAIAINDAGTVFAGFSSGNKGGVVPGAIYISTNDGTSWTQSNSGIANPDVHFIECSSHGEIYAVNGQENGELFRSINNGATWSSTSITWMTSDWMGMLFDGMYTFITTDAGVMRSMNDGVDWNLTNDGLQNTFLSGLISDGNQSLYASTMKSGVYYSSNAGGNWTQQLNGFNKFDIQAIARTKKGTLIAAQNRGAIFRSIDNGATWMKSDTGKPVTQSLNYYLMVSDSDHIFLGLLCMLNFSGKWRTLYEIYRSSDDGISWRMMSDSIQNVSVQSIQIVDNAILLAGGGNGLFRSLDHGWSWNKINNAVGATPIMNMHYNRSTNRLLVATTKGLYVSNDRGDTFSPIDTTIVSQNWAVISNCDVFVISSGGNDVRLSSDAGKTWTQIASGLGSRDINNFLWTSDGNLFAGTSGGVYQTAQNISVPPSAPQLVSPHDTSSNVLVSVMLQWLASCNGSSYHLQVATDQSFTKIIFDTTGLSNTQCNISNLKSFTQYFWRVQAFGNNLNSLWSDAWSFTTMVLPPPAPTLSYPSNNANSVLTNIIMRWNAASEAVSYHLQIATDSSFTTIIFDQNNILSASQTVNSLVNGTTHFWRVRARNSAGEGAWSTVWKFTTVFTKPIAPILLAPNDSATGIATSLSLSWNAVNGATSYRIQISLDTSFVNPVLDQSGIISSTFNAANLAANTKHFWRVNAANNAGTSDWSNVWNFTTALNPPLTPTLMSPNDNAVGISKDTTLTWDGVFNANSYRVQVSTDQTFASMIIDSTVRTASINVYGLMNNTKYYWRVNATNASGTSNWSDVWSFVTKIAPPLAPTLLSPIDNATNISLPTLVSWTVSATATSYRLQIALDSFFITPIVDQVTMIPTSFSLTGLLNNTKYYWRVNAVNAGGTSPWSTIWSFTSTPSTSIQDGETVHDFFLAQNYPNPFSQSTVLDYQLAASGYVRLEVLDIFGRIIAVLVDEEKDAGKHTSTFDIRYLGSKIPSGVYVYRLHTAGQNLTKVMLVTN